MSPTLNPQDTALNRFFRDYVLVLRSAVEFRKGDVVVLKDPGSDNRIIKRLAAAGNEFIRKDDGGLVYVPPGHWWVEGDNPEKSVDSRTFEAVPQGLLDSLVIAVVWPFWRSRWLEIADEEEPLHEGFAQPQAEPLESRKQKEVFELEKVFEQEAQDLRDAFSSASSSSSSQESPEVIQQEVQDLLDALSPASSSSSSQESPETPMPEVKAPEEPSKVVVEIAPPAESPAAPAIGKPGGATCSAVE